MKIIVLVILILVPISIYWLYSKFIIYTERFQATPETYITEKRKEYTIIPFKDVKPDAKLQVINYLNDEWKKDTGITYTEEFVNNTWKFPDALYVMTDKDDDFIGCSGIDRYMSYPFISHIYVKKPYRKKGIGAKLFDVVVQHAKSVGYKTVHGWCKDELVPYYESFNCERCASSTLLKPFLGFNLMKLNL